MDPTQAPTAEPQPPQPKRAKWSTGKIVALVLGLFLLLCLAAAGIGYAAWTSHQKALERERIAAEKARLAELTRNVEVFRGDMKTYLDSPASSDMQGMKMTADGEVGRFEAFLDLKMTTYVTALKDHDDAMVSFHNNKASLSALTSDDHDLSRSNADLATMKASSEKFYSTAQGLFSEQSLRDWFKSSDIPTATQDELVKIALQFSARYNAKLKDAQQTENSAWDAHQKFFDLLKDQQGNWKVSGNTITWYNRSGYNQSEQLTNDQITLMNQALDTLWSAVNLKVTRTDLTS